jgi:hypothetical protein
MATRLGDAMALREAGSAPRGSGKQREQRKS